MSKPDDDWPDDEALDAWAAAKANAGDDEKGAWLLCRILWRVYTGEPATEASRPYVESLRAKLERATSNPGRLKALNLFAVNPPNKSASPVDEKLREQAATAAAVILLEGAGLPNGGEALEQLAALSGISKRTLERYLHDFGKKNYAALKKRDGAELRALANRCYEAELTELDRQRSVVAAVQFVTRHTGKSEKEAFALLRAHIKAPFEFRKADAVARMAAAAQRNAEPAEIDACADEITAIAGQIVAVNREALADESRLNKLDRKFRDRLKRASDEALRKTADLYYAVPLAAILSRKGQ